MIATAIIPTLPAALMPAGLMSVVFGVALVALAAGFGGLLVAIVRQDRAALAAAVRATRIAHLAPATPLSRAA